MGEAIPVLFIFISFFFPGSLGRPLTVLSLLGILAILLPGRFSDGGLTFVIAALVFVIMCDAGTVSFGSEEFRVDALIGTLVESSSLRSGRKSGYRVKIEGVISGEDAYSASGTVYVISPSADLYVGDRVILTGTFRNAFFISSSATLLDRPISGGIRKKIITYIRSSLYNGSDSGEAAIRLILGSGYNAGFSLSESAKSSGLSHVLALSGMHLSIIAMILSVFLKRIGRAGFVILSCFLLFFVWLSGWRASLVRAYLFMLSLRIFERGDAFLISFIAEMLLFPHYIHDLGFIYSVLSLAGILIFSSPIAVSLDELLPIPHSFLVSVSASISALIFSVPITMSVFGSYSLTALIASFPASLMIGVYMAVALFSIPLRPLKAVLPALYIPIEKFFSLSSTIPMISSFTPYAVLLIVAVLLIISGAYIKESR